jgi:hypothetical protein
MTKRGSALPVVYITYRIVSVGEWYETIKIIIKGNTDLFDSITMIIFYFSAVVAIFDTTIDVGNRNGNGPTTEPKPTPKGLVSTSPISVALFFISTMMLAATCRRS